MLQPRRFKRIAQVDGGIEMEFAPHSLKVINSNDQYVNPGQLAIRCSSSSMLN